MVTHGDCDDNDECDSRGDDDDDGECVEHASVSVGDGDISDVPVGDGDSVADNGDG